MAQSTPFRTLGHITWALHLLHRSMARMQKLLLGRSWEQLIRRKLHATEGLTGMLKQVRRVVFSSGRCLMNLMSPSDSADLWELDPVGTWICSSINQKSFQWSWWSYSNVALVPVRKEPSLTCQIFRETMNIMNVGGDSSSTCLTEKSLVGTSNHRQIDKLP